MQFEELREKLLREGATPRHVRRYLIELREHLSDLTEKELIAGYDAENAAIRARAALGSDSQLIEALLREPGVRSLSTRAPWLVFGLLPPFAGMLPLLLPTVLLAIFAIRHGLLTRDLIAPPEWFQHFSTMVADVSNLLLVPLVASMFTAIAWRQRMKLMWPLLATVILLLFVHMQMHFPGGRPGGGSFAIGIFTPIFHPAAAWKIIAAQWGWLSGEWLLGLSPLVWLVVHSRKRNAA